MDKTVIKLKLQSQSEYTCLLLLSFHSSIFIYFVTLHHASPYLKFKIYQKIL